MALWDWLDQASGWALVSVVWLGLSLGAVLALVAAAWKESRRAK